MGISCNMGTHDLPCMYALGLQAYISESAHVTTIS